MAFKDQIDLLIGRIAGEFATVRAEIPPIEFKTQAEYDGLTPVSGVLYVIIPE